MMEQPHERATNHHASFTPFRSQIPGYGLFCDPPNQINNRRVQGGGGWVAMSASDLARVGLLVASRGSWKGKRLIGDTPLVRGHAGGNSSLMNGWSDTMFSWGQVTAAGMSSNDSGNVII